MAKQNTSEAFEVLKEFLISNYNAKPASGGKEVVKRCHFCGDSRDPSKAHMYIGVKSDGSIVYNCFKCNASGCVDGRFLRNMGCYEPYIINLCQQQNQNKTSSNSTQNSNYRTNINYRRLIIPDTRNTLAYKKLEYLNNRLGIIFNPADAARFKIILNLKDFLHANNITKYTRHENIIDSINEYFIGFLSLDNSYVILRRIVPEGIVSEFADLRYINYNIFNRNPASKTYIIPNYINPVLPLDIHIAEGIFDILSVYLNLAPFGCNGVFGAVNGKSYISIVQQLVLSYGFTNFNLHLYLDSDVDKEKIINNTKELLRPFNCKIFIHVNGYENQKDFGVPRTMIVDNCIQI